MTAPKPCRAGDSIADIDTPALVLDVDAFDRNIASMAQFGRARGIAIRPHAKAHKSAHIARAQIAAGAVGVCVQKSSEALVLARLGIGNILVSNEIVPTKAKLDALAQAAALARIGIVVDSVELIEALAASARAHSVRYDVLVEIDVGQNRGGVGSPAIAADLARRVHAHHPSLRFVGLQAYHGGAQHLRTPEQRRDAIERAALRVTETKRAIAAAGLECERVCGAGTGTFMLETASGLWTELQVGSYVFMDRDYADNARDDDAPRFDHSLFVYARVISVHDDRIVIDAGHKSHAIDCGLPSVVEPGWQYFNGGDEHGVLRPIAGKTQAPLRVGDLVRLIPGHCDPTVNLHDDYVVFRGDRVEALWPVDARGCVR